MRYFSSSKAGQDFSDIGLCARSLFHSRPAVLERGGRVLVSACCAGCLSFSHHWHRYAPRALESILLFWLISTYSAQVSSDYPGTAILYFFIIITTLAVSAYLLLLSLTMLIAAS
jgi:hypothetical protein